MKKTTPSEKDKLDEILDRLEKIESTINPPFWKKLLQWIGNHFILLIILSIVAYFTWKTWMIIDHLQMSFEALKASIGENTNAVQTSIETGIDKIKGLKFWE